MHKQRDPRLGWQQDPPLPHSSSILGPSTQDELLSVPLKDKRGTVQHRDTVLHSAETARRYSMQAMQHKVAGTTECRGCNAMLSRWMPMGVQTGAKQGI